MTLIKRTLMLRDRELAEFEFDLATRKARVIDAEPAGDDLPVSADLVQLGDNRALNRLIRYRAISYRRADMQDGFDARRRRIQEHSREDRGRLTLERCQTRIEAYTALDISDASAQVAKIACFSCLAQLANFHSGNFGAIYKISSEAWRAAPVFDYGGSFGLFHGKYLIPEVLTDPFFFKLFCASRFSFLDPPWDWSWYNPRVLDGFEDRIIEAYTPYRDLVQHFAGLVVSAFAMQRKYVNKVASGKWAAV